MSQVLYGPRLGKEGQLRVGCSAGGHMESGESAAEACEREVWEETGLKVRATRLLGVYSNPDQLVIYKDGNKAFFVVLNFEAQVLEGELGLSDETTAFGWFSLEEMETMPIHANHKLRVEDAMLGGDAAMR